MTLDEFRRHPAYDYYIITLVSDCLVCDLETKFDNQYTIIYMTRPTSEDKKKDYIINVPRDIADESEEYIQNLLATDNYKDLEYIRKDNEFYFYLKTYYGFNNRFRTTKNTEVIIFENGGFVGNLGLSKKTMEKIY